MDANAKSALCKYGLKFTPDARENLTELRSDIRKFYRKLRLIQFFHNKTPSTDEHDIAKPENSLTPNRHRDIILESCIDFLLKHPLQSQGLREGKKVAFHNCRKVDQPYADIV